MGETLARKVKRGAAAGLLGLCMSAAIPAEANAKPLQHVNDRKLQKQVGRIIRAATPFPAEGLKLIETDEESAAGIDYTVLGNTDLKKIKSKDVSLLRKPDGTLQAIFATAIDIQNLDPANPLTADEDDSVREEVRMLTEANLDKIFGDKSADLGQTIDIQVYKAQ